MERTIVHFEVPADDIARAQAFYTQLFGWKFSAPPGFGDYWLIQTDEEGKALGGGLMKRQAPGQGLLNYIGVESVAESAAKVEQLGGKVVVPRSPVPGMGWFAVFQDTEGNLLAMWQQDPSAA
jgi:predicted enzyme related to lactoylglutathione lyase